MGTPALEALTNSESEARKEEKPIITRAQSQVKNESYLLCFLVGQKYAGGYGPLHFLVLQVQVSAPPRHPGWEKPGAGGQHAWGALEASLSLQGVEVCTRLHAAARGWSQCLADNVLTASYVHVLIPRACERYLAAKGSLQM